jgi:hypothetical protein
MYPRDHNPPHFHVVGLDGRDALVRLGTLDVLNGTVDRRAMREAVEWAQANPAYHEESGITSPTVDIYDPLTVRRQVRIVRADMIATPVLRVLFDDGVERIVDFSEIVASSKWFRMLSVPTTFETVEVVNNGRALQWVTGVDYCADALRILADEQLAAGAAG